MEEDGRMWTGFIWLRAGTGGGYCQHGDELSGSIKAGICGHAERLLGFLEGLCSVELVTFYSHHFVREPRNIFHTGM
jgi:hypothetical protein